MYVNHPLDADHLYYVPAHRLQSQSEWTRAEAVAAARSMFGAKMMAAMKLELRHVTWHGTELAVVNGTLMELAPKIVSQVIWELAELEWRYELFALDRVAALTVWADVDVDIVRTAMITRVFTPYSSFVTLSQEFPTVNPSITDATCSLHLPALSALCDLMVSWPDCHDAIINGSFAVPHPDNQEVPELATLEAEVMLFYCQSFCDFFGRPPVLLHRLPLP